MIKKEKLIWSLFMGLLATILLIPVDILNVQSSNDIEESYTTEDPQIGMMYLFLIFIIAFSIFYLKIFTIKNKIPILIIVGLALFWGLVCSYFLYNYKHIEMYNFTFFLILALNVLSFEKGRKIVWNLIGIALIILFFIIATYLWYQTS